MTDTTDRTVRNIVLPVEVYEGLTQWHDSMWDPIYALHSTGRSNLVSLEMIDEAYDSLERHVRRSTGAVKKQGLDLLGELDGVRQFWREHSAKAYGIELDGAGEPTYLVFATYRSAGRVFRDEKHAFAWAQSQANLTNSIWHVYHPSYKDDEPVPVTPARWGEGGEGSLGRAR